MTCPVQQYDGCRVTVVMHVCVISSWDMYVLRVYCKDRRISAKNATDVLIGHDRDDGRIGRCRDVNDHVVAYPTEMLCRSPCVLSANFKSALRFGSLVFL